MKLNIEEGNFTIKLRLGRPFAGESGLPRKEMDVSPGPATLKQLLTALTQNYRFAGRFPIRLLDPMDGEVSRDFGVSVNGTEYELLPDRLETPVKEGDDLEITMVMLGGG
ncbi:MAG: MoaD/ThiS family protein [Chloroflexi bacterium]|nr:MoaD/ThiS family protein [Chloroflexota bacterium]